MQILFAISVFCFVGILWAALALARRIKAAILRNSQPQVSEPNFRHYFEAAASPLYKTAYEPVREPVSATEPIYTQAPGPASIFIAPTHARIDHSHHTTAPLSIAPPIDRKSRQGTLHQSVADITANKDWALPRQPVHMERLPRLPIESRKKSVPPRKPPQPARHGPVELLDPAYFNKDLGDLNDPYQPQQQPRLRVNDRRQ